jgi:pimeloyl-ACP methyl ester carboxylesterase
MSRQTLVLLPGLLNTRRLFERQIEDLADIADVIVGEPWRHDTLAAAAKAALDEAPERFALGGFSLGGYACFEILRRAPERVTRLALIDTQAIADTPEQSARRRGLIEQSRIGRFKGVQPSLLPSLVHPSRLGDPSIVQPIAEMAVEVGADGFRNEQTVAISRPDSRPLLVEIKVPTVVIVGRQDQVTPIARAHEMAADISHSHLVVIEDAGHMTPLEKPAEVSAALRRWLTL